MRKIQALFRILGRWKMHYLAAGLLLLLSSFIRMLEPKVIQLTVDGIVNHAQSTVANHHPDAVIRFFMIFVPEINQTNLQYALLSMALIFVVISVLQAMARFSSGILSSHSTEKAAQEVRNKLFTHIQAMTLAGMDKFPKGEMIQRCTGDIDTVRRFMNDQVTELLRMSGMLVGGFVMMAMVHVPYALVSVSLMIPIIWWSIRFFQKEAGLWEQHEKEQDKLTAIIQENLSGIRVVQAFGQEQREWDRFTVQNQVKRGMGIQHVDLHKWFWSLNAALCSIQLTFAFFFGAYLTLNQQITIGEFAGFFTYSIMVVWPMRQVGQIVSQLGMASVAVQRIQEILNTEEEDYNNENFDNQPFVGEIEFKNVSFTYPHASQREPALQNISFKAKAGEKVALMGSTGAGKSTIIALLLRFYEPDSGEILLDGKPLSQYSKTKLRRRIGVVHQKAFLFSTTVRQNIGYAQPDTEGDWQLVQQTAWGEEDFEAAARDAQVSRFIGKLHSGMETVVGEKGVTLSGGQKQRVALARTLLSQPDILVLDDATSAVDTETEYEIQQALQNRLQNKTAFIIAHRLTSTQYADTIIVLDKGRIIEKGSHQELLLKNGFYKQVFDIQVSIEEAL